MTYTVTTERQGLYVQVTRHDTLDEARGRAWRVVTDLDTDTRPGTRRTWATAARADALALEPGGTLRLPSTKITLKAAA